MLTEEANMLISTAQRFMDNVWYQIAVDFYSKWKPAPCTQAAGSAAMVLTSLPLSRIQDS